MTTRLLYGGLMACFFSLGSLPGLAQTAPDAPVATTPAVSLAPASDSAKAVRRLFTSRRTGSTILGLPGGYMLGYGLVTSLQNEVNGGPATLGVGAILSAVSIGKGVRFSKDREADILADHQQGKPLPKNIRRRLHKKHFRS